MALACAALALPGLSMLSTNAHAENAPENGLIAFKYLRYQDSQPGLKRITVDAPSVYLLAPISGGWSVEASAVVDSLSGATPRSHSTKSSATGYPTGKGMSDYRKAGDIKLTKYFSRAAISLGYSTGDEHDYFAKGVSIDGRWSTENNNTTFNVGYGHDSDKIRGPNPDFGTAPEAVKGRKVTDQLIFGITQVLTSNDILQANLSYSDGRSKDMEKGNSAFNDPYKSFDTRPETRKSTVLLGRWNHYIGSYGASLKTSYRYYRDSFKVSSNTFGVDWVQPVGAAMTLTPSIRYFSQSAADFYVDYDSTSPNDGVPTCLSNPAQPLCGKQYASLDQRLSAFGAVTLGLKASYQITKQWTVDGKAEYYTQRSNWRLGGKGSPGIDTFNAQFYQVGVSRSF
jgi:Protein of unknown function (DUF3570)